MAIVREFDCANGAHVIVRDDCYRDCTPEEIARRWERVKQVVTQIEYRRQMEALKREDSYDQHPGAAPA